MIFAFLWGILKFLLVICGIIIIAGMILDLITRPFRRKKEEKEEKKFREELTTLLINSLLDAAVETTQKEVKTKKTPSKRGRKPKEN